MCAQWTVRFGSKAGQVSYTMAEPRGTARLDVLLVCPEDVSPPDLERMSQVLAERNLRCFASTLTPLRTPDAPDPVVPWTQLSPDQHSDSVPTDSMATLRALLSRIADRERAGALALVLIGQGALTAREILETDLDPGAGPSPLTILRIAQWHWIENSDEEKAGTGATSMSTRGLLVTEGTNRLDAILEWLEKTAAPWLLAKGDDKGGPGV